jgi:hypothetical protein
MVLPFVVDPIDPHASERYVFEPGQLRDLRGDLGQSAVAEVEKRRPRLLILEDGLPCELSHLSFLFAGNECIWAETGF